jgi:glycosyltransferase involved in cell wall biosynthesis
VLFVSTVEPRKNLGVLLDAFERLRDSGEYDGSLVVVGKIGWKSEAIARRLRGPRIVHLDYLRASQLATVYRQAEVFVFPSIYEGFGFPLLEAMAQGVPSIAARSSSLPEVGGDAALYFAPPAGGCRAARGARGARAGAGGGVPLGRGRGRDAAGAQAGGGVTGKHRHRLCDDDNRCGC